MRFTIDQSQLLQALDAVSDVVPSKTAIPVLSHLLVVGLQEKSDQAGPAKGHIALSATDLDISITASLSVSLSEPGRFTVPARKFIEIVRELPEGPLSIQAEDHKVTLCSSALGGKSPSVDSEGGGIQPGQGIYILMGLPPEDYPELPAGIEGTLLQFGENNGFDGNIFKNMISKTAFAVSRDETRPVLNGVLCQIRPEGITMVATDGHRLVRHSKSFDLKRYLKGSEQTEVIIPPRALQHLVKLLSGTNTLTRCVIGENHILFDLDQTKLFSRLIEGPYVDFEQVIPQNNTHRLNVSNSAITPSVRRVSILSNTQTHQIRLRLGQHELELSAVSQDVGGEARESIPADYTGQEMEVGYNSVYLLDILKRIDSEDVVFDLNTPVTAGIVRPAVQPEGEDYLCLLMPLRLSD
ncbi:MAG: DNA polymerase III subunit beta [Candidatus Handelsmanbacteria bacterium RIFCSPLOWO2_12_FULL_64_10]|uniref:Beta sliding clamp n=1 Tax=Handelsmanbacteria sp. (strain RIFCSPLOWO2_12_FULL_64_10) TaxID=1817868 RepID=A0A1F6CRI8_HANXR|nr:MAG: DNA polymerase III subunit beta [Candidatus Handelsmanbacteria bacterium RIFCSPLOWO2_12_FULL_64_10]